MDKQTTKRSVNWEQEEKDLLSNLVLDKLEVIENARIDTNTNKIKREAWNTVHNLFNKVSKNKRSIEQIQNQWRKTKSLAKTKNSAYLRQTKKTGGGPAPEPLNSVEEELICRLPKHFEIDKNIYDSNSINVEIPLKIDEIKSNPQVEINFSNEILDCEEINLENIKPKKNTKSEKFDENSKRIKLLDVSIKQKELEMKFMEENHFMQKKKNEIINLQLIEEHGLKMEKLKLEIEKLKKFQYRSISDDF